MPEPLTGTSGSNEFPGHDGARGRGFWQQLALRHVLSSGWPQPVTTHQSHMQATPVVYGITWDTSARGGVRTPPSAQGCCLSSLLSSHTSMHQVPGILPHCLQKQHERCHCVSSGGSTQALVYLGVLQKFLPLPEMFVICWPNFLSSASVSPLTKAALRPDAFYDSILFVFFTD